MEAEFENLEPKSKRRKLSTKQNSKKSIQVYPPHDPGPDSVGDSETMVPAQPGSASVRDEEFAKFCNDLLSCHLRAIGNCNWKTLPEFPEFQMDSADEDKEGEEEEAITVQASSGFHARSGPSQLSMSSRTISPPCLESRLMDKSSGHVSTCFTSRNQMVATSRTFDKLPSHCTSDKSVVRAVPLRTMDSRTGYPSNRRKPDVGDSCVMDSAASSAPSVPSPLLSSSTALPSCCPICQFEFPISLEQMETDAHIAACLAAATDDLTW